MPRPELRRTHQNFEYPPKREWKSDTMVLTVLVGITTSFTTSMGTMNYVLASMWISEGSLFGR
eukprot:4052613-Karenia_brevis.AAC.1